MTDSSHRLAYSPQEAAELTSLSEKKIRRMIQTGELRSLKIGQRRVIPAAELERLLQPQLAPAAEAFAAADLPTVFSPAAPDEPQASTGVSNAEHS